MFPGFAEVPGKKDLTVKLARIMIPFLLFIALAAKAMGVLNAKGVFGVPALASAFFNLTSLGAGLTLAFAAGPLLGIEPIVGMAIGTLLGGMGAVWLPVAELTEDRSSFSARLRSLRPRAAANAAADGSGGHWSGGRADQRSCQQHFRFPDYGCGGKCVGRPGLLARIRVSFYATAAGACSGWRWPRRRCRRFLRAPVAVVSTNSVIPCRGRWGLSSC